MNHYLKNPGNPVSPNPAPVPHLGPVSYEHALTKIYKQTVECHEGSHSSLGLASESDPPLPVAEPGVSCSTTIEPTLEGRVLGRVPIYELRGEGRKDRVGETAQLQVTGADGQSLFIGVGMLGNLSHEDSRDLKTLSAYFWVDGDEHGDLPRGVVDPNLCWGSGLVRSPDLNFSNVILNLGSSLVLQPGATPPTTQVVFSADAEFMRTPPAAAGNGAQNPVREK